MTTALALICTAIIAYLVGKRAGVNQAAAYLQAMLNPTSSEEHVRAQRENAEWQ